MTDYLYSPRIPYRPGIPMGPGRSGIGEQPFSMMALDASMRANSSGLNLDTRETSSGKWLDWHVVETGCDWMLWVWTTRLRRWVPKHSAS